MAEPWERDLDRWVAASLIDVDTAARVRAWEREQSKTSGLQWPVLLAVAFGAILLGSGILLFISAHWDEISPGGRMALVLLMVGGFHVAGALTIERFEALGLSLHAIGTISLGAGIALTGQIFHLQEHWPGGVLMWAAGAVLGWVLLRHWSQYVMAAILIPAWLVSEWSHASPLGGTLPALFLFLTSITYLTSRDPALEWIGGLTVIPLAVALGLQQYRAAPGLTLEIVAWVVSLALPLGLAFWLRGRAALFNVGTAAWAVTVYLLSHAAHRNELWNYPLYGLFALAVIAWGLRENHIGMINLGVAGFALTVITFYFSQVMDKLGRSASLIALGILFIGGGWLLERMRRRLVQQVRGDHP